MIKNLIYRPFAKRVWLITVFASFSVHAEIETNFSGFGTLGYAVSDQSYNYLKYIDNDGTFLRDSRIGGQLDVRFDSKWSATVQGLIASDDSNDSGYETKLAWAFLSYRPTSDWLFRAGKLRGPGFLNSANRDIGVTYDYVRIPAEYDTVSPVYDFLGANVSKMFALDESDITLDVYWGKDDYDWRYYISDDLPNGMSKGGFYNPVDIEVLGTAFKYETFESTYLMGLYYAHVENEGSMPWFKKIGESAAGYYSVLESDGAVLTDHFDMYIVNLGADIALGNDYRLMTEFAYRKPVGLPFGLDSLQGYLSLRKRINDWTPYITYAQIKTSSDKLEEYLTYANSKVPSAAPMATTINLMQRGIADSYQAYDQYSIAVGSSYRFSPESVLKAEMMMVYVGDVSYLFDAAEEDNISDTNSVVFSLSYSFTF